VNCEKLRPDLGGIETQTLRYNRGFREREKLRPDLGGIETLFGIICYLLFVIWSEKLRPDLGGIETI